jgi:hypothetical protein
MSNVPPKIDLIQLSSTSYLLTCTKHSQTNRDKVTIASLPSLLFSRIFGIDFRIESRPDHGGRTSASSHGKDDGNAGDMIRLKGKTADIGLGTHEIRPKDKKVCCTRFSKLQSAQTRQRQSPFTA